MTVTRILALILIVLAVGCAWHDNSNWTSFAEPKHPWGYYSGSPITQWEPDGRNMTLVSELRYTDPQGVVWIAPAGSVVDGASIPRSLWSFMGGPFEGQYRNASILHDVAYDQHNRPWQDCDRMFYNAMRCSGVSRVEAGTMYYALYKFGHHWKVTIRKAKPVPIKKAKRVKASEIAAQTPPIPRALPVSSEELAELNEARDWIRNANPSLDEIEQRAEAANQ
jgi:Protein of unknown function (DUF1353)